MGQRLPSVVLHRFAGEPRPGKDVDVYARDGVQYIRSSRKGVSFLHIDDSGAAGRSFQAAFRGPPCHLTAPGAELREGFAMVEGVELRWPPPRRGIFRVEQASSVIGRHYMLVPLVDMPLVDYSAELERIKSSAVCRLATTAGGASARSGSEEPLPAAEDWLEPSDTCTMWIAYAMQALGEDQREPVSVRVTALALLASILAADMMLEEELLVRPDVAAWALAAMEQYEAPEDDIVADCICWDVELQLQEALESPHPPAAVA